MSPNHLIDQLAEYKAQSLRFGEALVQVLDGVQPHDLSSFTGLDEDKCESIYQVFVEALTILNTPAPAPNARINQ